MYSEYAVSEGWSPEQSTRDEAVSQEREVAAIMTIARELDPAQRTLALEMLKALANWSERESA